MFSNYILGPFSYSEPSFQEIPVPIFNQFSSCFESEILYTIIKWSDML